LAGDWEGRAPDPAAAPGAEERLRIDKWLWQARFVKSRSLAATLAASGKLRVNGSHCTKAAQTVRPGDVLTFPQGRHVRVIRIEALGTRRGPAGEAATLYTDLDPPRPRASEEPPAPATPGAREPGEGRPTKRERREIDRLRRRDP
jgi:ribosome-associated heat shock protein Hsp15